MYKVLVVGMTSNPGGMESVVRNYYQNIDKSKIQFDFLCVSQKPIAYEEEFRKNGAVIYRVTARSQNYIKFKIELFKFFRKHASKYQAIWQNECSLTNIDYLYYAKIFGIPKRIIHCHNSDNMGGALRFALHIFHQHMIRYIATDFWSCS